MNLKQIAAKRKIFELYYEGVINNLIIERNTNKLCFKQIEKEIYWLTDEQNNLLRKRGTYIKSLKSYLIDLKNSKEKIEPSIEKINHLRDSITANIVGIIYFLHQKFPAQKIALENLDEYKGDIKFIESHRKQSDQHISRRLEWALYRKFQQEGLVPPHIKQTILLKDEYETTQFGIIQFIETKGTSANCPNCNTEYKKTNDHYICKDKKCCGFQVKMKMKEKG